MFAAFRYLESRKSSQIRYVKQTTVRKFTTF